MYYIRLLTLQIMPAYCSDCNIANTRGEILPIILGLNSNRFNPFIASEAYKPPLAGKGLMHSCIELCPEECME